MKYIILLALLSGCVSVSKHVSDSKETWISETTYFAGLVSGTSYFYCTKESEKEPKCGPVKMNRVFYEK